FDDISDKGLGDTLENYSMFGQMRMSATDLLDVTGATYTYLMNGRGPASNWKALFKPGEKVRLRFINASAGTTAFDVRIPGLKMTVVHVDGQDVEPVPVDELRIGIAETYDVIVQPEEEKPYTMFAESMDRSGYASGTLAPREGMAAAVPDLRPRPKRSMKDMGMKMDMEDDMPMDGMDHPTGHDDMNMKKSGKAPPVKHGPDRHGRGA